MAARFYTAAEAQMASAYLSSGGVQSWVFDSGVNLVELGGIAAPVRLMVDEAELEAAQALLTEADQR